jgi:hypothetical protein
MKPSRFGCSQGKVRLAGLNLNFFFIVHNFTESFGHNNSERLEYKHMRIPDWIVVRPLRWRDSLSASGFGKSVSSKLVSQMTHGDDPAEADWSHVLSFLYT